MYWKISFVSLSLSVSLYSRSLLFWKVKALWFSFNIVSSKEWNYFWGKRTSAITFLYQLTKQATIKQSRKTKNKLQLTLCFVRVNIVLKIKFNDLLEQFIARLVVVYSVVSILEILRALLELCSKQLQIQVCLFNERSQSSKKQKLSPDLSPRILRYACKCDISFGREKKDGN